MRILVTGGRYYIHRDRVFKMLTKYAPSVVINGGCRTGADAYARSWARRNKVELITHDADWEGLGDIAGNARNEMMLKEHRPDMVLHFTGGRGTFDMVERSRLRGILTVNGSHIEPKPAEVITVTSLRR